MSRYSHHSLDAGYRARRSFIHPVWRGIGCLFIILVPIISFAAARLLVQANSRQGWVEVPVEIRGAFNVELIGSVSYADLAATLVLIILGFAILTVFYALLFRLFGPSPYSPIDAPPR
jgi:hypothetical protein